MVSPCDFHDFFIMEALMIRYILKRVFSALITLFIIITVTFFTMKALPGDPFSSDLNMPPMVKEKLRQKYGFDKPVGEQYLLYLKNIAHLDLGDSMKYQNVSVNSIIADYFPVSATLGLLSAATGVLIGILFGIIAGLYRNRLPDYLISVLAVIGVCVPSFVLASLLQISLGGRIFPVARWGTPMHMVMPVMTLAIGIIAFQSRLMKTSVVETVNQDFIKTAKAMGLSRGEIIRRHVIKNSILPNITVLGPLLASLLGGTFIVEKIFAIPGLGKYYIESIQQSDYTMIMGMTIFYALLLLVLTLIVDIAYGFIDPRIKVYKTRE